MFPIGVMEKLLLDVENYARTVGRKPQSVLRAAIGTGWGVWNTWCARTSSPTMVVADRLYAYMNANPATSDATPRQDGAA